MKHLTDKELLHHINEDAEEGHIHTEYSREWDRRHRPTDKRDYEAMKDFIILAVTLGLVADMAINQEQSLVFRAMLMLFQFVQRMG